MRPAIPAFKAANPLIDIRLRLSDRKVDLTGEGLDAAFFLGLPEDSTLKLRKIADCARLLCAAPDYLARKGVPQALKRCNPVNMTVSTCVYPGAPEFQWPLQTRSGLKKVAVRGPFESDHGDVLTEWALAGHGIVLKPRFEIAEHLASGKLVAVLEHEPPLPVQSGCLYPHRKHAGSEGEAVSRFSWSGISRPRSQKNVSA